MTARQHRLRSGAEQVRLGCQRQGDELQLETDQGERQFQVVQEEGEVVLRRDGETIRGVVLVERDQVTVSFNGRSWTLARVREAGEAPAETRSGDIEAPMTGTVLEVLCAAGDPVEAGAPLIILEAMKMEHRLTAPAASVVAAVDAEPGQQVDIGHCLIRLDPA